MENFIFLCSAMCDLKKSQKLPTSETQRTVANYYQRCNSGRIIMRKR